MNVPSAIFWVGLSVALAATTYTPDKKAAAAYVAARAAGTEAAKNALSGDAAAIAAGELLYKVRCVACHGEGAKGDGVAAMALTPKPADLTDPVRWAATTVGIKHWIILRGIDGTGMAPTGLTPDEGWRILAYLEAKYHRT